MKKRIVSVWLALALIIAMVPQVIIHANATTTNALQNFIDGCDSRYFSEDDIEGFDAEDCMYARNAIYAKSGWDFSSQQLKSYFQKYSWYTPSVNADDFTEDMLNKYQIANRDLILAYQDGIDSEQKVPSDVGESNIWDSTKWHMTDQQAEAYAQVIRDAERGFSTVDVYGAKKAVYATLVNIDEKAVLWIAGVALADYEPSWPGDIAFGDGSMQIVFEEIWEWDGSAAVEFDVVSKYGADVNLWSEGFEIFTYYNGLDADGEAWSALYSLTDDGISKSPQWCHAWGWIYDYKLEMYQLNIEGKNKREIAKTFFNGMITNNRWPDLPYEWTTISFLHEFSSTEFYAEVTGGNGYKEFYESKANKNGGYWPEATDKAVQCAAYIAEQDGTWIESDYAVDYLVEYTPVVTVDDYVRTEWIKQHMEYAASDEYQSEIVSGFNDQMLAVFRDALNDEEIQSYNARKALSAVLRVDVEFDDADVFEALIAQVLYGKGGRELAELAFEENYQMVISDLTRSLVNAVNSSDAVKEVSKDTRDSINEIYKLLQTLEYGSDEYGKTLRTFFGQFKNNGADILKTWKTELIGDAAFTGLGIVIDGAFEQYDALEDIVTYLSNYIAYQNMSEQTREVLVRLAVNVMYNYEDWYGVSELIDELGFLDSAKNWSAFETALLSVIDAMADYEQKGAAAIAEYAVERERAAGERFASKTVKAVKIFAIEKIASCIPVVNTILIAKNVTSAVLDVSILLDQILTNVDDRAYALDVLTKTYCISVMLDKTVEDCADSMSDDDFYSTTVFDESVSIYKKNLLLASGYASKYTHMVLARAFELYEKYIEEDEAVFNLHREKLFEIISTYSSHLDGIIAQKAEIQEIICHDPDLQYNPLTDEIVYNLEDCRIYVVACPVDVIVTTDTGEQIAYLSGVDNQVSEGHEFYFHTIEAANDPGEYIKVAIVPNNYRIDLKGTDDGIMHVLVADFTTGDTGLVETYFNIPIKKDSIGYFEDVSEDSDEGSLVVDQVSYSNMESAEDIPTDSARNHVWIWIIGGLIICGIILGVLPQKKSNR